MPAVNGVGEPCAGEPHARFDGRGLETEQPGNGHGSEAPAGEAGKSGTGPNARPRHRASPRPYSRPPAAAGPILFAVGLDGPDLLLIQRSGELRRHAGEPAFPGGTIDAADDGPVAAALREAAEEVGVDPGGVDILAILPELFIPPTRFRVVPVLAWWRRPCAVAPMGPSEVAAVARVSVTELAGPSARLTVRMPIGATSPAFRVRGMLIWGTTALLVDRLLAFAGWERPWNTAQVIDL
jgi:8-oxo-dGTP pyrophosphatase MutT (NUDIX family)